MKKTGFRHSVRQAYFGGICLGQPIVSLHKNGIFQIHNICKSAKKYTSNKKVYIFPAFSWIVRMLFFAKMRLSVRHG